MRPFIVYFSTKSNNTHRFTEKLDCDKVRIPIDINDEISIDRDYILIVPTYGGGGYTKNGNVDTKGCVKSQVIHFLNNEKNRSHCIGVISSGNTNFAASFAIAGEIISKKLGVPWLYKFELLGTKYDVENVQKILDEKFKNV